MRLMRYETYESPNAMRLSKLCSTLGFRGPPLIGYWKADMIVRAEKPATTRDSIIIIVQQSLILCIQAKQQNILDNAITTNPSRSGEAQVERQVEDLP